MARALAFLRVRDSDGDVQGSKAITFREEDDSTSFASNLYAARSGGAPITTLNTDGEGYAKIFVDLADARPFNWRVAGDAAGVLDQFIPDPRDLVNLSAAQTITGAKQINTPTLVTPIFSGTATGFQTAEIKNAAGDVALRFKGTVDTAVALGTWTATNGSPNLTAPGDVATAILRDQAIKISESGQVFRVKSCLHSGGTTTIILSANYTGVTGLVTLLKDDDEVFEVKTGNSDSWFKIDSKGDIRTFGTFEVQSPHYQDTSDDGSWSNGLWYDAVHRGLHVPHRIFFTAIGDPFDVAIRYANGVAGDVPDASPQAAVSGANLGAIYWMAHHGTGWGLRSSAIHCFITETPTPTTGGGRLEFRTTQNGTNAPIARWDIDHDGAFRVRNNANSAYLKVLDRDSGDNINIGRDDTINLIQLYGPVDVYSSVASPGTPLRVNSQAGILLPVADPPTANYATQRSINHVVGTVVYTAGVPALAGDYNCASVTDQGTGDVTVTVDTDFANVNYALVHAAHDSSVRHQTSTLGKAAGSFRIQIVATGGNVLTDPAGAQNSVDFIASGLQ